MSNAINIVIKRDDATDLTLIPVSSYSQDGVLSASFRELSTTKPLAACVRLTLEAELLKSGVMKVTRKLEVPVMEIIPNGAVNADGRTAAPAVSHVETDIRTRYHHPRSTATERADSLKMATHVDAGAGGPGQGLGITGAVAYAWRDVASNYQIPYGDINYVWPSA